MYILNENIHKLRKQSGMTQEELAAKIGVSKGTISNYENDITRPSCSRLSKIADAFNVKVRDLLMGSVSSEGLNELAPYENGFPEYTLKSPNGELTLSEMINAFVYCDENNSVVMFSYNSGECMPFEDFDGDKIIINDDETVYIINTKSKKGTQYRCEGHNIGEIVLSRKISDIHD